MSQQYYSVLQPGKASWVILFWGGSFPETSIVQFSDSLLVDAPNMQSRFLRTA